MFSRSSAGSKNQVVPVAVPESEFLPKELSVVANSARVFSNADAVVERVVPSMARPLRHADSPSRLDWLACTMQWKFRRNMLMRRWSILGILVAMAEQ
jgi:hypothetical protein